jgi:hypothetical protein
MKEDEIDGTCSMHWEGETKCKILVENSKVRTSLWRLRRRLEDDIKTDLDK